MSKKNSPHWTESKVTTARRVAYKILFNCRVKQLRVRDYLRISPEFISLSSQDKAFVTRLVLGVTLTYGKLDQAIKNHLKRGIHLEPKVQDTLRIGVYEILYLDTRVDAAIYQGVELVKAVSSRSSGLANALLRRISEQERLLTHIDNPSTIEELSWVSGIPEWMCLEMQDSLGSSVAQKLLVNLRNPAPIYVFNRGLSFEQQSDQSLDVFPTCLSDVYKVKNPALLNADTYIQKVMLVPADFASQFISYLVASYVHNRILEIGQGRGTKSLLLSHALGFYHNSSAYITAVEVSKRKSLISQKRLEIAGISHQVTSIPFDATTLDLEEVPSELSCFFDVVFIDAPCSGMGTLRRHPEIAWKLKPQSLYNKSEITRLQIELLRSASSRVSFGGYLVYATCSLSGSENEQVIKHFLSTQEGQAFEIDTIENCPGVDCLSSEARAFLSACTTSEGFIQTAYASIHSTIDCDAHFMAVLKRR